MRGGGSSNRRGGCRRGCRRGHGGCGRGSRGWWGLGQDPSVKLFLGYHLDLDGHEGVIDAAQFRTLTIEHAGLFSLEPGFVDPAGDGVSQHDLVTREEIVFEWIDSQESPAAFVLAGGYVGDGLTRNELVALHVATITKAHEIWARKQAEKQRRSNRWRLGEEEVRR